MKQRDRSPTISDTTCFRSKASTTGMAAQIYRRGILSSVVACCLSWRWGLAGLVCVEDEWCFFPRAASFFRFDLFTVFYLMALVTYKYFLMR